ncbi:MAG: hypothetical protein MSC31_00415 [Solirubrobacteraceae bacterium MAG38_C4-C5]|nr:hypothetical protein [Candidatus Siliceabacter maunaloa]
MSAPKPPIARHRARVEAALRVAAPLLDLVLATGDRLSRTLSRGDRGNASPPVHVAGDRGRTVGPGPEGSD